MKKLNKKGFTIVELVIVIAVIAILAAVLIPTFTGLVDDAKESAALQKATSIHTNLLIDNQGDLDFAETGADLYIVVTESGKQYVYSVTDGSIASATVTITGGAIEGYTKVVETAYTWFTTDKYPGDVYFFTVANNAN